jgi:GNAT superfamily N-acetyltransferase
VHSEADAVTEPLEDGWSSPAPETDSLLRGYVLGFARMMADIGHAIDGRVLETEDVIAVDTGADFFLANGAALRHPVRDEALPGIVDALHDFYGEGPGVGWVLMSAWPIPPIARMGLVGHPPFMIRAAGGGAPPMPDGLEIREATSGADMADFARALEGYPAPHTDVFANGRLVDVPGMHWYVGYLDDRPVACSGAHVTDACVDVEFVATHEDVRGHGYGAAITWAATLADPSKPAVLVASDPGQPVYQRMGYLRVMRLTMWGGAPAR